MITTKKSQKERIIDYIIQFGSISCWEAYKDLGITQLGARIDKLKKEGFQFETKWEHGKNRYGESTTYKRYFLVDTLNYIPRID